MHPEFFRTAAAIAAHAHTGGPVSLVTHPPLLMMVAGSLIAGFIITALTSAFRRTVG